MKRPETNETRFAEKNTLKRHMESGTSRCDAGITSQAKEGASRESKRHYLHFLYIARGSLSEAQYFVHLSR
jgi:four helix bundle protein